MGPMRAPAEFYRFLFAGAPASSATPVFQHKLVRTVT
jgi:hypothetical protein